MSEIVSIAQCVDYEQERVEQAIDENLAHLGGIDRFIAKGSSVFLKVNLLRAARPADAITTHPAIVQGLAKLLVDYGAKVVVGDSPGAGTPFTERSLRHVYRVTGLLEAVPAAGAQLNYDTEVVPVSFEGGKLIKRFNVMKPIMDADVVISVAKAKTHDFTYLTGAMKNLFGIIPGFEKPGYHAKLRNVHHFSQMLVDLCELVRPRLSFLDAITCMEGNGPALGDPRHGGLLMASTSPVCLDYAFSRIVGLEHHVVPTLREAASRGLLPAHGEIDWKGEPLGKARLENFKLPDTIDEADGYSNGSLMVKLARPFLKDLCSVKPVIMRDKCKDCGICYQSCPVGAVTSIDSKALINPDECIRCYCCHEMCPHGSIELKRSLAYTVLKRLM